MADFRAKGQRFDALALDMEWIQGARDVAERNDHLLDLVKRTRALVGNQPLGGIVFPAVQLEVLNPALWPDFPYRKLAEDIDVWLPMTYWTFRSGDYRDAYRYTSESIQRLRADLHDKSAVVHPVGGIGDESTANDYEAYLRAVRDAQAVGWSVYDFNTMVSSSWPRMRGGPTEPAGAPATTTTTTSGPAARSPSR
jgi:hypothetical protein